MTSPSSFLLAEWQKLTSTVPITLSQLLWDELCQCYSEPHRAYHHLVHIADVWQLLAPYYEQLDNPVAVKWAVLYHDIIYDTTKRDNELQSALFAQNRLNTLGYEAIEIQRVSDLIIATQTHEAALGDNDMQLFLDADLAILGYEPAQYQQYTRAIRSEYAWVNPEHYRNGRIAVLTQLLNKQPFYYTAAFREQYETQARQNVNNEIISLNTSLP